MSDWTDLFHYSFNRKCICEGNKGLGAMVLSSDKPQCSLIGCYSLYKVKFARSKGVPEVTMDGLRMMKYAASKICGAFGKATSR
jgi:hypothetical protein